MADRRTFCPLRSQEATAYCRHCEEPTGPAFGRPDDKLRDEQSILPFRGKMDCFAEPVIERAFARPVGSQ
jgi:hypothetical protein